MTKKKWFVRLLLAVVLSLVLRTVWLVGEREWNRSAGERELAAAFAATEATDPDWQWKRLAASRQFPPPERNAANLIPRIKAAIPAEWIRGIDAGKWEPELAPERANRRLSDEAIAALRRHLAPVNEAILLARTLEDFPEGNRALQLAPDVVSTQLQETADTRLIARLLRGDTLLAVADGEPDRAAGNLLALLNASRSVGDEPFLISQVIRIATRSIAARCLESVLANVTLSEAWLAKLQAAWIQDAEEPLLLFGLRGERAGYDVMFRNLADGTVTPDSMTGQPKASLSFDGYAWWLYRGRLPAERAAYHRWVSESVAAARLPVHEQPAAFRALPPLPPEEMKMATLFLPAVEKVAASSWRSVAVARCVVAALACERYRLRQGKWPERLTDLPKDLLPRVPLDPFDGQPLRYRRLADGIVVSSVGKSDDADGGAIVKDRPANGLDLALRLWNVPMRGAKVSE